MFVSRVVSENSGKVFTYLMRSVVALAILITLANESSQAYYRSDITLGAPLVATKTAHSSVKTHVTTSNSAQVINIPTKQNIKSAPTITFASLAAPPIYTADGSGVYNTIFSKLITDYPGDIEITFAPPVRRNTIFASGIVDCNYLTSNSTPTGNHDGTGKTVFIGPINTLNVVAYVHKTTDDISTFDDLKNVNIGVEANLERIVRQKGLSNIYQSQQVTQLIDFLLRDRVHAFIAHDYLLDSILKSENLTDTIKKTPIMVASYATGMRCYVNEKTMPLIETVRRNFTTLKSSGYFKTLFESD